MALERLRRLDPLEGLQKSGLFRFVLPNEMVGVVKRGRVPADRRPFYPGEGNLSLFGEPVVGRWPAWELLNNVRLEETVTITTVPVYTSSPKVIESATKDGARVRADLSAVIKGTNPYDYYAINPHGPNRRELRPEMGSPREQFRDPIIEGILDGADEYLDSRGINTFPGLETYEQLFDKEKRENIIDQLRRDLQLYLDEKIVKATDPVGFRFLTETLPALGIDRRDLGDPALNEVLGDANIPRGIVVENVVPELLQVDQQIYRARNQIITAPDLARSRQIMLEALGGNAEAFAAVTAAEAAQEAGSRPGTTSVTVLNAGGGGGGGLSGAVLGELFRRRQLPGGEE